MLRLVRAVLGNALSWKESKEMRNTRIVEVKG